MIEGIILAIGAGLMLGLYALPEKFTKDFKFENTWGLFFMLTMFAVPIVATTTLIKDFTTVFAAVPSSVILGMVVASGFWAIGVMLWGKAINHIGLSLGFSLFIGTVILVGSVLPFLVEGLPPTKTLVVILVGILVVLAGVILNGKAGLIREKDEGKSNSSERSMGRGIAIAVVGGLLATGFSYANAAGRPAIHEACQAAGNEEWVTAVGVMFPIFITGGVILAIYFSWQLTTKKAWSAFKTPAFGKNFGLILVMAVLHYVASALFAFAAFKLGEVGNTVGYAIFNTASVATAIVSGLVTGEWLQASAKAKKFLYGSLACMIFGILIIAVGNAL